MCYFRLYLVLQHKVGLEYSRRAVAVAHQHYPLVIELANSLNILLCSFFDLLLSIPLDFLFGCEIDSGLLRMLNSPYSKVFGREVHHKGAIEERSSSFSMAQGDAAVSLKFESFSNLKLVFFCVGENHVCYFFDEPI